MSKANVQIPPTGQAVPAAHAKPEHKSADTRALIKQKQAEYDEIAGKIKDSTQTDKKFELEVREEMKKKLKSRGVDRTSLVKQKGDIHRELVELQNQRMGEIVAGVDKGQITPEDAKAELVTLGHTPASADIEIRRALKQPQPTFAPEPAQTAPVAPLPQKDGTAAAAADQAPLNVLDPISSAKPQSEAISPGTAPSPAKK